MLAEHGAERLLAAQVRAGQIGGQDLVPVGALHAQGELVAGDAGVIDQNVDFAEAGDGGLDAGLDLLFTGHIDLEGFSLPTGTADLVGGFLQLLLIPRRQGHGGARFRQRQGAGAPDALRGAGHQRHTSVQPDAAISGACLRHGCS